MMATFVKLTSASKGNLPVWVNLDLVRHMDRQAATRQSDYWPAMPERTVLWFDMTGQTVDDWHREEVLETPVEILDGAAS